MMNADRKKVKQSVVHADGSDLQGQKEVQTRRRRRSPEFRERSHLGKRESPLNAKRSIKTILMSLFFLIKMKNLVKHHFLSVIKLILR